MEYLLHHIVPGSGGGEPRANQADTIPGPKELTVWGWRGRYDTDTGTNRAYA